MEKIKIVVSFVLAFILIYFLHVNFFNNFTIAGIKPNMFIIFMTFISLYTSRRYIIILATIFGILFDILVSNIIGLTPIIFIIIGIVTSYIERYLSKDGKLTIILIVMGTTATYEILNYILQAIKFSSIIEAYTFFKICSIEILYNIILTIIVYPIWRKTGPYIEDEFKDTNNISQYL